MFGKLRSHFGCNLAIGVQVRFATKKASGSKTSMKDSVGRRLGPKKYEGQLVKPGEIIFRQRGTKFYPGEYTGIGKDHTIFSKELGYVRYYLDPFHPKRKFIGVALDISSKLPTPHFDPTPRRFGRKALDNPRAYMKEESSLPRREFLSNNNELKAQAEANTEKEQNEIKDYLKALNVAQSLDEELTVEYLHRVRSYIRNGITIQDAQFYARQHLKFKIQLQSKKEAWDQAKIDSTLKSLYENCNFIDRNVSFDNKFRLIPYITDDTKKEMKKKLADTILELKNNPNSKDAKKATTEMFENASHFLTISDELHFKKILSKLIHDFKSNVDLLKQKNGNIKFTKRFNYVNNEIEDIQDARAL